MSKDQDFFRCEFASVMVLVLTSFGTRTLGNSTFDLALCMFFTSCEVGSWLANMLRNAIWFPTLTGSVPYGGNGASRRSFDLCRRHRLLSDGVSIRNVSGIWQNGFRTFDKIWQFQFVRNWWRHLSYFDTQVKR